MAAQRNGRHRRAAPPALGWVDTVRGAGGSVAAWLLSILLVTTGTLHFATPSGFEAIVPQILGSPALWVYASGAAEIACGVALAARLTRRIGALAAAVLFVLVFPANVRMALESGGAGHGLFHNPVVAWGRLPLQIPLVVWALYIARRTQRRPAPH